MQHRDLAAGKWWELSLAEQMGNVGSEFGRAVRWMGSQPARAEAAFHRALELFDLTLDDPRHRRSAPRLREIARAREVVVDFLSGANEYGSTAVSLQRYFDAFAVVARKAPEGCADDHSRSKDNSILDSPAGVSDDRSGRRASTSGLE